jgi:hypothetical protein
MGTKDLSICGEILRIKCPPDQREYQADKPIEPDFAHFCGFVFPVIDSLAKQFFRLGGFLP